MAQTTSTIDKVKQSGSMTLAYRESSIPFSYLGAEAKPVGFAYEICEKIADNVKKASGRADMQKQYQAVTSANRHPAAAERHDRHRVRLDHEQQRARQAGPVRDQLLLQRARASW